ncbi:hypothetical protein DFH06DRAFT_1179100 [Mycena polygramma]|nr:hypothetical protein DFH06DRAFT_1179100 [Mycena polygramma]
MQLFAHLVSPQTLLCLVRAKTFVKLIPQDFVKLIPHQSVDVWWSFQASRRPQALQHDQQRSSFLHNSASP